MKFLEPILFIFTGILSVKIKTLKWKIRNINSTTFLTGILLVNILNPKRGGAGGTPYSSGHFEKQTHFHQKSIPIFVSFHFLSCMEFLEPILFIFTGILSVKIKTLKWKIRNINSTTFLTNKIPVKKLDSKRGGAGGTPYSSGHFEKQTHFHQKSIPFLVS